MAGFTDILGALLKNGLSQSGSSRAGNVFGSGSGKGLNDIAGSIGDMLSGTQGSKNSGLGGMLGEVMGSLGNNKAALGGLGALAGALLGGGGKSAKGAIGGGALAMLGSLAFSALKNSGQKPSQMPRALLGAETEQEQQEMEDDANVLVKAMINAAKADGAIDNTELQKIVGKFEEDGLTASEKDFFMSESVKPLDIEGVVASAQGRAELAAQIYAASYLAIEVDTIKEQEYMKNLASGLRLDEKTKQYLEKSLTAS